MGVNGSGKALNQERVTRWGDEAVGTPWPVANGTADGGRCGQPSERRLEAASTPEPFFNSSHLLRIGRTRFGGDVAQ